jgi:hypothetical protein
MGSVASASGRTVSGESAPDYPSRLKPYVRTMFNDPSVADAQPWVLGNIGRNELSLATYASNFRRSLVQVSLYRITDNLLAESLVNDASNGATVQVLLDGSAQTRGCHGEAGCVNHTFQILEQLNTINQQPGRSGTWLKTCAGYGPGHPTPIAGAGNGCLGQTLNHNKFILASQTLLQHHTGPISIKDVVFQTSSNDDDDQYYEAFNNALIIADRPAVYHDYQRYFDREAAAYRSTQRRTSQVFTDRTGTATDDWTLANHDIETLSYPRAPDDDPLQTALQSVSTRDHCANQATTPGSPARTTIDLGMFEVDGPKSTLAELAHLASAGCPVHIVYTNISHTAYRILHRHNISLQQLCTTATSYNPNLKEAPSRYFVHSKYLLIVGTTRPLGRNRRIVITGSDNLGTGSLTHADNRDIRYVEPARKAPVFTAYQSNFQQMRQLGAHKPELGYACSAKDNG